MSSADGKRRLPVLQTKDADEDEGPKRPPWHWIAIGTSTTLMAWLGLAAIVGWLAKSLSEGAERSAAFVAVAGNLAAFALAAFGGGLLVGRFGQKARAKEAALGAAGAAVCGWAMAAVVAPLGSELASIVVLAVLVGAALGAGWAGGRVGVSRRPR